MYGSSIQRTPQELDENAAIRILQHLDKNELQQLLDDESKLMELINDVQQLKKIRQDKETLLASNKSLADYNLSKEPRLAQGKAQLAEVYERAVEFQKQYDTNKQKLDYIGEQQSLDTTLALLQTETAKSEEDSEEIAERWLDGDSEVEDFIEQFQKKRTEAHLRRVKTDKMKEIMRRGPTANPGAPYSINYGAPQGAAPQMNSWGPSVGTPYPVGQYGMPEPYLPR